MHQAAVLDGPALDAHAFQQDGLPPAEIDIRRGQVVEALGNRCLAPTLRLGLLMLRSALLK
jgi:hypothetical protein